MAIYINGNQIALDNEEIQGKITDALVPYQNKTITFDGESILLTTALNRVNERASGKANIVVAEELPATTQPNTQYWVSEYDGQTLPDGCFIIITDNLNVSHYVGTSSVDLSIYYTKTETDALLDLKQNITDNSLTTTAKTIPGAIKENKSNIDLKQDKLTDDTAYGNNPGNSDTLATTDLTNKKVKKITFSNLWTWIKGKITSVYYPVGTVIFNTGTNPGTNFGGTWALYATGTKALYLDRTAGTTVNEELPDPSLSMNSVGKKTIGSSGNVLVMKYNSTATNAWGIDYGSKQYRIESELSAPVETASNHKHTITVGNSTYKESGKVRAAGITICAWKRTA